MRRQGWWCCGVGLLLAAGIWSVREGITRRANAEETAAPAPAETKTSAIKPGTERVGRKVANFVLEDTAGKQVALADFQEKPVVVLFLMGTGCPISNLYLPECIAAQKEHGEWLQIIGINSQGGDTREEVAKHATEFELNFPVLCDPQQRVADQLGAARTAEVFVLDAQRVIRYHGRVDDRYSYGTKRDEPTRRDAAEAIRELREGLPVSVPETQADGCLITRKESAQAAEVTYAREVSRLLQAKCQACHRPKGTAPFALMDYSDAVNWSAMMQEVVLEQRMPPWHADPRYGHFSNDRRLTPEEINTLTAWVKGGTPEGNPADLPEPVKYDDDGWRIGTPDVVFELPREVSVPATGTVDYQYFTTETKFEEDVWIQAAEARPGNRAVVHHIIVFYKEPGKKRQDLEGNWLVAAAPGDSPLVLPEGMGRKIPKGATLIWQMHYTPTGKPETDRSQVAFKFTKEPPAIDARVHGIKNNKFEVPAGAANHPVSAGFTLPRPATIFALFPHMHLRGKSFEYRVTYPDGRKEVLLSVPQFDFNWQSTYRFVEPLHLPKGARLECVAHFDNSAGNPANPDPKQPVRWGDQTWEEMMIGYVEYTWDE